MELKNENTELELENPKAAIVNKLSKNGFLLRLMMFRTLPLAALAKVKINSFSPEECKTSIPYRYLNKNPFNSTYFAALSMAAEFSTGYLVLYQVYKRNISWIVTATEAKFHKKAIGITYFYCDEGEKIAEAVQDLIKTKNSKILKLHSTGKNKNGDVIASFNFTWSLKIKDNIK